MVCMLILFLTLGCGFGSVNVHHFFQLFVLGLLPRGRSGYEIWLVKFLASGS